MSEQASSPLGAALWMMGAVASFSLMAIAGRELSGALDTFELMLCRSLIGAILVIGFGALTGRLHEARTTRLRTHMIRNLFHFAGQNLWFYAVALIPLAQLFAIEFTTPIWIALLAPLLLGETLTRWRIIAAVMGFAGILIIAQPGTGALNAGHLTAALATIGFTGSIMITKALSRTETTWNILFWLTITQGFYGLIAAGWDGDITVPDPASLGWVILIGVGGLTAHLSITSALKLAPASVVAPMDFVRLPLIALVGMFAYDEALESVFILGAVLILAANTLNLRAETRPQPKKATP